MNTNQTVLFNIKFKASVKKLEELLALRDIENANMLLEKMQKEANNIAIDTLDSFSGKLQSIQHNSSKKIKEQMDDFKLLSEKFLEGCEAILNNQFQSDTHKKEVIELLSVHLGMAHHNNDAKSYREALIAFRDWFKDVYQRLAQLIEEKNHKDFELLIEELSTKAQTVQAKEILYFVSMQNQINVQEKNQFKLLIDAYQKSITT
ncbi:MAG: hypothetical protein JXQ76_08255 [Campylobacterales bacterium]|nr:hypothetical protein [Campylobacterales bacterium]